MKNISNLFCIGCGANIQSDDSSKIGYVTPNLLEEKELDNLICQRCFQIKNYNKITKNDIDIEVYEEIFNKSINKKALFIYIIDVFDFEASFIKEINELLVGKDVILVANKFDLLPKSLKENKLENIIRSRVNKTGIKCIDCFVTSIKKLNYVDELVELIDKKRNHRDVYVVGASNVGKSTFINSLLSSVGLTKNLITTSVIPGTTIDLIQIPFFEDNRFLIDTPGIINKGNILNYLPAEYYKKVMPNKEIKARNYQLNDKQTIIINGLAMFSYVSGEKQTITFYMNNNLVLHRTKYERSDLLFPSRNKELFDVDVFEYEEVEFNIKDKCELVILGLGFIRVSTGTFKFKVIKGTEIIKREQFIG